MGIDKNADLRNASRGELLAIIAPQQALIARLEATIEVLQLRVGAMEEQLRKSGGPEGSSNGSSWCGRTSRLREHR